MIIHSSKALKNYKSLAIKTVKEEKPAIVEEEVKPIVTNKEVISCKKKNKKIIPTPVVVEEIPVVVEEKTEDEDLSKWLEEHTEG